MRKYSLFIVILMLLAGNIATFAQTKQPYSPPKQLKVVQHEGVSLKLVPPQGQSFYEHPELVRMGRLAQPGSLVFTVSMRPADFIAAQEGSTKDVTFSVTSVDKFVIGHDVSDNTFAKMRKVMNDTWSANLAKIVAKGDIQTYDKKVNQELSGKYDVSVDGSISRTTDLGIIVEGDKFITSGILSTNNVVKVSGVSKKSDWVILSTLVLVKQKMITLLLCVPLKPPGSLVDAKATMSQWVTTFLAKNKQP